MNKQELFNTMNGRISMTSIKEYCGTYQIIGKFGMVEWMDDYWDVWVTAHHKGKELGTGKVNNLCQSIFDSVGIEMEKLSHEAIGKVQDNEGAFLCAVLLGSRRKRKDSIKTLERLRKTNFGQSNG
ncbi:MAG: hypothetical protein O7D95_02925 [Betaproteobacteria bacterium]|nr:hypothetical protein [Betaproteobacteria bacterium]